MTTLYGAGIEC